MSARLHIMVVGFALFMVTVTCNWPGDHYFIPPHSTPTLPAEIALLAGTPDPALMYTPTPPVVEQVLPGVAAPRANDPPPTAGPTPVDFVTPILYYVQAADTLPEVAVRFGVRPEEITSPNPLPLTSLLTPGQLLVIPRRLSNTTSSQHILPDSELVYSPSAADFDIAAYVNKAGGKLSQYKEWLKSTGVLTGAQVVQRVANENSINPRLLLALIEYQSGWVFGQPASQDQDDYPLGMLDLRYKGLFRQLVWSVNQLSVGYYSWREGRMTDLEFSKDGYKTRLAPDLNAGSVALQYYFARLYDSSRWLQAVDLDKGFPALFGRMFGNPWQRALTVEPLYPPGLTQPPLSLPFQVGRIWSFTGGPHGAWEDEGSYAALDFAPSSSEPGCVDSNAWVAASASGLVVRSGKGVVVLDLDGDGREQTGWVVIYLHVSSESGVPVGTWVDQGDPLGHPSCESGHSTGTHVHIARKFNGEWIAADGPMPFNLSGWIAHAGSAAYSGYLTRGDQKVVACTCSTRETYIELTANPQ
jgi:LasA protease